MDDRRNRSPGGVVYLVARSTPNTENFLENEGRRIPGSAGAVAGPLPPVVQEEFWLPIDTDPMPYAPARMLAGGYFPVASNIMTKTI